MQRLWKPRWLFTPSPWSSMCDQYRPGSGKARGTGRGELLSAVPKWVTFIPLAQLVGGSLWPRPGAAPHPHTDLTALLNTCVRDCLSGRPGALVPEHHTKSLFAKRTGSLGTTFGDPCLRQGCIWFQDCGVQDGGQEVKPLRKHGVGGAGDRKERSPRTGKLSGEHSRGWVRMAPPHGMFWARQSSKPLTGVNFNPASHP